MKLYCTLFAVLSVMLFSSCAKNRIKEHKDWGKFYEDRGIKNACFIMRDNNHETIHFYNKERCLARFLPASTFNIFTSLVSLETAVAPDDQFMIKWDSVKRKPEWDKDMNLREAMKVSNPSYFQELARRLGAERMQHFLDTIKYGNMKVGAHVDSCWFDNSLQVSSDEQVGFVKRLYFSELPVSERSQRIVRSMLLREETPTYKLYYQTGTYSINGNANIYWMTGFIERIVKVKEPKESMNKSDERNYPYFFSQNFEVPAGDTSRDWSQARLEIAKQVLNDYGAMPVVGK